MSQKQRVLLTALQIAGLGIILVAVGFFKDVSGLKICGLLVFALGMVRFLMFSRLLKDSNEDGSGESLDSIIEEAKAKEEKEQKARESEAEETEENRQKEEKKREDQAVCLPDNDDVTRLEEVEEVTQFVTHYPSDPNERPSDPEA